MKLAMLSKDVGRATDGVRPGRLRLFGCWAVPLSALALALVAAESVLAGGVPVPRNVRPSKIIPARPAAMSNNSATPHEAPPNATSRTPLTYRYVRRQQDLRQRLSTAARANDAVENDPAPPEGEAVVVDDVRAPSVAVDDSRTPTGTAEPAGSAPRSAPIAIHAPTEPAPHVALHSYRIEGPPPAEDDTTIFDPEPALANRAATDGDHRRYPAGSAPPAAPVALHSSQVDAPQPVEEHTPAFDAEPALENTAEPANTPATDRVPIEDNSPVFTQAPAKQTTEGPFEIIDQSGELSVTLRRSKLLRTKLNVYRTAVVDPSICDVIQFTPREVSIVGKAQGATTITFWFEDDAAHQPLTYLVRVTPDPEVPQRREEQYQVLQDLINGLFPDSKVRLTAVADKLLVQGQARDVEEAAQILAVIRGQAVVGNGGNGGGFGLVDGTAADPLVQEETGKRLPATQVVNMLRVPGEQQVALRVKIAELSRSAARRFGVDLDMSFIDGNLLLESFLAAAGGNAPSVIGHFDGDQINFGIHYLERHGVVRLLSEPTLVTLSGQPASFVAGGEFAVPTVVGVGGAAAVTTDFRAFGAIITFLPVVLDKDRIRLQVSPEFSKINQSLSVNNTPGLNTRAVATTVEMREGQTLAIAGLLDDSMDANLSGNVPFLYRVLGVRNVSRNETELLILVTPELVHALDPEEVPPLPGFDVTEPTNWEFFAEGKLEGKPTLEYRSTVWPVLKQRYRSGGSAMISGPFGHGQ
jgi:pilus assembly protein CpaC